MCSQHWRSFNEILDAAAGHIKGRSVGQHIIGDAGDLGGGSLLAKCWRVSQRLRWLDQEVQFFLDLPRVEINHSAIEFYDVRLLVDLDCMVFQQPGCFGVKCKNDHCVPGSAIAMSTSSSIANLLCP